MSEIHTETEGYYNKYILSEKKRLKIHKNINIKSQPIQLFSYLDLSPLPALWAMTAPLVKALALFWLQSALRPQFRVQNGNVVVCPDAPLTCDGIFCPLEYFVPPDKIFH